MSGQTEVYFHVGLPKTASTYVQVLVFPKLKGIKSFPKKKFNHYKKLHASGIVGKFLVTGVTHPVNKMVNNNVTSFISLLHCVQLD